MYSKREQVRKLALPPQRFLAMRTMFTKLLLLVLAFTLIVPESYARRMGSGRSVGRQAGVTRQYRVPPSMSRTQPAPPPPAHQSVPPQRAQPDLAQQYGPPPAAPRNVPQRAGSPWGGFLGGALVGLGLGSLLGHRNADPNAVNQTEGSSGTSADDTQGGVQPAQQEERGGFGSLGLLALVAAVVYFLVRRVRRR
jgi:hypothetical protein